MSAGEAARTRETVRLSGFVNAHSHSFQRALRGRGENGDFWSWRDAMIEFASSLETEQLRPLYAAAYSEMLAAGYTAVGEFHYLGADAARAVVEAAADAAMPLVLIHVAYERGGARRFRQRSAAAYVEELEALREAGVRVAAAVHSVRACSPAWLEAVAEYARAEGLPLHVHADEQPREIAECLEEHGLRPVELLERAGCLGPRTTVIHATHADDRELDLLAAAGARVCVCPTTEANLGDGFMPVQRLVERGIELCVGSDSNVRIDPLEELREIELTARRAAGRRGVLATERLLEYGSSSGAAALGLGSWPEIALDANHPSLDGVADDDLIDAAIFGCSADVLSPIPAAGDA